MPAMQDAAAAGPDASLGLSHSAPFALLGPADTATYNTEPAGTGAHHMADPWPAQPTQGLSQLNPKV